MENESFVKRSDFHFFQIDVPYLSIPSSERMLVARNSLFGKRRFFPIFDK
jgi:hypothetical protein